MLNQSDMRQTNTTGRGGEILGQIRDDFWCILVFTVSIIIRETIDHKGCDNHATVNVGHLSPWSWSSTSDRPQLSQLRVMQQDCGSHRYNSPAGPVSRSVSSPHLQDAESLSSSVSGPDSPSLTRSVRLWEGSRGIFWFWKNSQRIFWVFDIIGSFFR